MKTIEVTKQNELTPKELNVVNNLHWGEWHYQMCEQHSEWKEVGMSNFIETWPTVTLEDVKVRLIGFKDEHESKGSFNTEIIKTHKSGITDSYGNSIYWYCYYSIIRDTTC